jgi:hypothetical protein
VLARIRRHEAPLPPWWRVRGHKQLTALVVVDEAARAYARTGSGVLYTRLAEALAVLTAAFYEPGTAFAGDALDDSEARRLWCVADAAWIADRQMRAMLAAQRAKKFHEADMWAARAQESLGAMGDAVEVAA